MSKRKIIIRYFFTNGCTARGRMIGRRVSPGMQSDCFQCESNVEQGEKLSHFKFRSAYRRSIVSPRFKISFSISKIYFLLFSPCSIRQRHACITGIYIYEQSQSFNDFISSFYEQLNSKKLFFILLRLIKADIISYKSKRQSLGRSISDVSYFQQKNFLIHFSHHCAWEFGFVIGFRHITASVIIYSMFWTICPNRKVILINVC